MALTQITGEGLQSTLAIGSEGGAVTTSVQQGLAKAWTNFNGESTPSARDSFNHSSITDTTTGQYSVSLSNSMNNANYTLANIAGDNGNDGFYVVQSINTDTPTTSATPIRTPYADGSLGDPKFVGVIHFGDLA